MLPHRQCTMSTLIISRVLLGSNPALITQQEHFHLILLNN